MVDFTAIANLSIVQGDRLRCSSHLKAINHSPSATVTMILHRLLILLPAIFVSCARDVVPGAYQAAIREQGYVAYNQPVGNPKSRSDWEKYGPGTVLRLASKAYYFPAKTLLGEDGVQNAMLPANSSPINLFSNRKISGYDFDGKGGWTLDAVNQIAGSLEVAKLADVEIQFGQAWLANPLGEGQLRPLVETNVALQTDGTAKKALRRKQFAIVQNAVFTDSIRYVFKKQTGTGASAIYKLTAQEIAALQAKGFSANSGGVEVNEPRFIAFTPLSIDGLNLKP